MVSSVTLKDSFAAAPASLPTASGSQAAVGSPAQADGESGVSSRQQAEEEERQQEEQQRQSRVAIVPGAGALVPRASPIYHIGSLPTLFESPTSSDEVQTCCPA